MRKTEIRDSTEELDRQLRAGRATRASQREERARLVEACRSAGDHVFGATFTGAGVVQACEFCGLLENAGQQQLARNLQVG